MTYKILLLGLFSIIFQNFYAQHHDINYFLPTDVSYSNEIPKPSEVLGFVSGDWHISHDKVLQYMYEIAKASDRISIEN